MGRLLTTLAVLALLLAACGGTADSETGADSTGGESSQSTPADDEPATPSTQAPSEGGSDGGSASSGLPPGGTGTVTVDGETIESEWVGNCMIDEQFDPQPGDLDLTAGLGGIQALFLEISNQQLAMGAEPFEYTQLRASMQLRDDSGQMATFEDLIFVGTQEGTWYEDADSAAAVMLARGEEPDKAPLDEAPMVLSGNNITGTVTFEEGAVVSFDLDFIEPVDCSL